ncbi:MAG: hypothetical protein EOM90_16725 [Alphaproteobacteria bacterium]|nr:hypothetical protein [Alphaproteobacteria bacterium]
MGNSTFFNHGQLSENESDFQEYSLLSAAPAKPAAGLIRTYMDTDGVLNMIDAAGDTVKAITGTQVNMDDAVSKKHAAGTDQGLDTGGANAVTVADVKSAVDLKHSNTADHAQGTDTGLDTGGTNPVTAATIKGVTDLVKPGAGAHSVIVGSGGAGHLNTAAGDNNVVGGIDNTSAGNKNLVVGSNQICGGHNNIVAGNSHNLPDVTESFNAVFGDDNEITGACNLVCGKSNGCKGDYNHIEGYGNSTDLDNTGDIDYTHLEGKEALGTMSNVHVQAAGKFTGSVAGSAQYMSFVVKGITTDATPVDLLLDGAAIVLWSESAMYATKVTVVCTDLDTETVGAYYALAALVQCAPTSGQVSVLGSVSKSVVHESNAAFDVNLSVNDVLHTLKITATGAAETTLRWVAFVEMVQVSFAAL